MIFGPTPLAEAEGRILAHTLRLPDGDVVRKGRVLTAADLARLEAAGVEAPVTVLLEEGDLGEDAAAVRVARALAGPGVQVEEPALGRVNLVAEAAGVLRVDPRAVVRANRLDGAVQVSTLTPFTPVRSGRLVASVKVVTFGIAESALAPIVAEAGEGVAVAAYRDRRVGLVLTRFPETPDRSLDLAERRLGTRVRDRGATLLPPRRCAHEADALAAALDDLRSRGAELLLVFGATATVDRADVLPRALEAGGGAVRRLGLPVDPGTLLVLGELGEVPVVGVPGCARSPRPSGFDAVLDRLLSGLPVSGDALAGMGVGGLLTDVAARPRPRSASGPDPAPGEAPRIAGLVLAAGSSRRMGDVNKLLVPVEGEPMVRRVAGTAREAGLDPVLAVVGHQGEAVTGALEGLEVGTVANPDHAEGLSTSLVAGLDALPESCDAVVVLLGDMPWVRSATLEALMAAYRPREGGTACVPVHEGKRGNPVLWGRRHWARMRALEGDRGARVLLGERAEEVREVPVEDPGVLRDVDHPGALPPSDSSGPSGSSGSAVKTG